MIADVVAWDVKDELPFDELNAAIEWVLSEQFIPSYAHPGKYLAGNLPKLFITPCPPRQVNLPRGGNSSMPVATYLQHGIVVSDEPCSEEKATELWLKYEEGLKGVIEDVDQHRTNEDDEQTQASS